MLLYFPKLVSDQERTKSLGDFTSWGQCFCTVGWVTGKAFKVDDAYPRQFYFKANTTTQQQPFYGSVEFVRENPGEPVPEETFTHYSHRSHQSSLSAFSI